MARIVNSEDFMLDWVGWHTIPNEQISIHKHMTLTQYEVWQEPRGVFLRVIREPIGSRDTVAEWDTMPTVREINDMMNDHFLRENRQ